MKKILIITLISVLVLKAGIHLKDYYTDYKSKRVELAKIEKHKSQDAFYKKYMPSIYDPLNSNIYNATTIEGKADFTISIVNDKVFYIKNNQQVIEGLIQEDLFIFKSIKNTIKFEFIGDDPYFYKLKLIHSNGYIQYLYKVMC